MNLHYLQHVPFEGPGCIETWALRAGHRVTATRLYAGEALPEIAAVDLLVIMGGPMSVHEEIAYPWLVKEKEFIRQVLSAEKAVLGVCLGAQLLADVMGAAVVSNRQREIGWFPVQKSEAAASSALAACLPEEFQAFHWHGETFELPAGTVHLGRSTACENQGFILDDRAVGLQFHLEITPAGLQRLVENCAGELENQPTIQQPEAMLEDEARFEHANGLMMAFLDRLAATAVEK